MPAYNFQKQFVPLILDGRKPHTIRRKRKRPTKVGDTLYLFTGLRTKQSLRFAETPCTSIDPVIVYPFAYRMQIFDTVIQSYLEMSPPFIEAVALKDGFESISNFFDFFKRYKREVLDDFEIIHWNPKDLQVPPSIARFMNVKHFVIMDDPFRDMTREEVDKALRGMKLEVSDGA